MARGWHYAKLSLSNARRLSFSGMCILLFLFLSLCRFCLFVVVVVVSHIQRIGGQPEKTILYTVANPARGLLNREKRTKEKVWQHTPPYPPHCSFEENK